MEWWDLQGQLTNYVCFLKIKKLWPQTEIPVDWVEAAMVHRIEDLFTSFIQYRRRKYKYNYSIPPPQIQVQTEPEVQSHVDAQVEYHLDPEVDGRDTSTKVKYNVLPQVQ